MKRAREELLDNLKCYRGGMVQISCNCDAASGCPQGKVGSQDRCRIWIEHGYLKRIALERQERLDRNDR